MSKITYGLELGVSYDGDTVCVLDVGPIATKVVQMLNNMISNARVHNAKLASDRKVC